MAKEYPSLGHGTIVTHQREDGSLQLRDDLSRLWCACGQPAVEYHDDLPAPYDFVCIKHNNEHLKSVSHIK